MNIFISLILFIIGIFSSTEIIASNNQKYPLTKEKTNQIDIYRQVEEIFFNPDPQKRVLSKYLINKLNKTVDKDKTYKACFYLSPNSTKLSSEQAYSMIEKYAQNNKDPFIWYVCASLNEEGKGTKKNLYQACEYYKNAHNSGYSKAKEPLGRTLNTLGMEKLKNKNEEEGFILFKKARELDNSNAWYNMGRCYEEGKGTSKDCKKAFEIYKTISMVGSLKKTDALFKMAEFYREGKGVQQDYPKALILYKQIKDFLQEEDKTKKAICFFNLGFLYYQKNKYDFELLKKASGYYQEAQKLGYSDFSGQLEAMKKDMLLANQLGKSYEENCSNISGESREKIFKLIANLLDKSQLDIGDFADFFKVLNKLKTNNEISDFLLFTEHFLSHPLFFKTNDKYKINNLILTLKKFIDNDFKNLEAINKNFFMLFPDTLILNGVQSILCELIKINDIHRLNAIFSLCPVLFIKILDTSSNKDEEYKTVRVETKSKDMDGIDRESILKALNNCDIQDFPLIELCVHSILTPSTKAIDIIRVIEDTREFLKEGREQKNNENQSTEISNNVYVPVSVLNMEKARIIKPFIQKLFNDKETIREKIQFIFEIGKMKYLTEPFIENSLKLIQAKMSVGEKISILHEIQRMSSQEFTSLLRYVLKVTHQCTNGQTIARILKVLHEMEDQEKIKAMYYNSIIIKAIDLEKIVGPQKAKNLTKNYRTNVDIMDLLSEEQIPIFLKIASQLLCKEIYDFMNYSAKYLINNEMSKSEIKEILTNFKKFSSYQRKIGAKIIKRCAHRSFEDTMRVFTEFEKLGVNLSERFDLRYIGDIFMEKTNLILKKYKKNASQVNLDIFTSICEVANKIDKEEINCFYKKEKSKLVLDIACKFLKDDIKKLVPFMNALNDLNYDKLHLLIELINSSNKYSINFDLTQVSIEKFEESLQVLKQFKKMRQLESYSLDIAKLITPSTTWVEYIEMAKILDELISKNLDFDIWGLISWDLSSFILYNQQKGNLVSLSLLAQAVEKMEPFVIKDIFHRKNCLDLLGDQVDLQSIMDIFNYTYYVDNQNLQTIAPYFKLFLEEGILVAHKDKLIDELRFINSNKLQTVVFHVLTSLEPQDTPEEILKKIEKISQYKYKRLVEKTLSMEDFVLYTKFTSKVCYKYDSSKQRLEDCFEILESLVRANNAPKFKILLENHGDQLEKISQSTDKMDTNYKLLIDNFINENEIQSIKILNKTNDDEKLN